LAAGVAGQQRVCLVGRTCTCGTIRPLRGEGGFPPGATGGACNRGRARKTTPKSSTESQKRRFSATALRSKWPPRPQKWPPRHARSRRAPPIDPMRHAKATAGSTPRSNGDGVGGTQIIDRGSQEAQLSIRHTRTGVTTVLWVGTCRASGWRSGVAGRISPGGASRCTGRCFRSGWPCGSLLGPPW
jgi:hypothetical protein